MLLTLCNQLFLALIGIVAARALHNAMLRAVVHAPMSFFQSTPLGRLINRFTKDVSDVDKNLINYTAMFLRGFFQLVSTFALIGFLTPFVLTVFTPLLFAFYMLYLYFQVRVTGLEGVEVLEHVFRPTCCMSEVGNQTGSMV
jgi:ATP-binding cassette subfamily C (CFTR/MRP) protein 1